MIGYTWTLSPRSCHTTLAMTCCLPLFWDLRSRISPHLTVWSVTCCQGMQSLHTSRILILRCKEGHSRHMVSSKFATYILNSWLLYSRPQPINVCPITQKPRLGSWDVIKGLASRQLFLICSYLTVLLLFDVLIDRRKYFRVEHYVGPSSMGSFVLSLERMEWIQFFFGSSLLHVFWC